MICHNLGHESTKQYTYGGDKPGHPSIMLLKLHSYNDYNRRQKYGNHGNSLIQDTDHFRGDI